MKEKTSCPFNKGDCVVNCELKVLGLCVFESIATALKQLNENTQQGLCAIYQELRRK